MLGCLNQTSGQKWTNPAAGSHFSITFLTQKLGLSNLPQSCVETTQYFLECRVSDHVLKCSNMLHTKEALGYQPMWQGVGT